MKNWKQKTLRFLKYFGLFLVLSIGAAFVFRDALLQKAITKIFGYILDKSVDVGIAILLNGLLK